MDAGALMVVTGGPRGHGSGRAATPEAEAERRAKIKAAALKRKEQVRVTIVASYRLRGRSVDMTGVRRRELGGWTYQIGRRYSTFIPANRADMSDPNNRAYLEDFLNERNPRRIHYNVRVALQ